MAEKVLEVRVSGDFDHPWKLHGTVTLVDGKLDYSKPELEELFQPLLRGQSPEKVFSQLYRGGWSNGYVKIGRTSP